MAPRIALPVVLRCDRTKKRSWTIAPRGIRKKLSRLNVKAFSVMVLAVYPRLSRQIGSNPVGRYMIRET